jgi:hypothetical protein
LQQAYLNYRILRDLDKKWMLPDSIAVERDALLSFWDIQNYLGEMAVFHGFEYFKETSPTILTRKRSATELVDTTLSFVKRLYSAFSSTGWYTESRWVTYCVARAAEGLRRSLGVNIWRHGDAHEIISGWLEQYARKIQWNLEKFQQSDRYNGFDTDFGSKHFHIPRGTTGWIIFIDTRPTGKHGNRLPIKGHAAWFVVAPDGKIIIFDPYYQGKSNSPARDIADYLSENSWKKFHSFIRDSKNRIWAVFFKGDPKNFLK